MDERDAARAAEIELWKAKHALETAAKMEEQSRRLERAKKMNRDYIANKRIAEAEKQGKVAERRAEERVGICAVFDGIVEENCFLPSSTPFYLSCFAGGSRGKARRCS